MHDIKILVYFDLEATGLKSSGKPRITELSLVAVNLQDVLELHKSITKYRETEGRNNLRQSLESLHPRVINKLSLCFYPMTTIMPGVTALTGLDNDNLSGQAQFDSEAVKMINTFLSRLPAPVCLVAHNGDYYDYPLLMAEIGKTGAELVEDILCVDSWVGAKDIFHNREVLKKELVAKEEMEALTKLIEDGEFDEDFDSDDSFENSDCNKRKTPFTDQDEVFKKSRIEEKENETTPVRPKISSEDKVAPFVVKTKSSSQTSVTSFFKSKKKLNFSDSVQSFSLINLHKTLLGVAPSQSHGAEVDCLALLRVTAALGQDWITWSMENCYKISDMKPMWGNKQ